MANAFNQGWFGPFPQTMQAQDVDSSGNLYYGEAPKGSNRSRARWTIFQTLYLTTAGPQGASVTQFPVDPHTGLGSDQPMFIMANATCGTASGGYLYASLGLSVAQSP